MSLDSILDFSKLYCHLHPFELVSNFCNDENCLVGLCATCICSHTQMHAQRGTVPHYQNIRDTFSSLHNEARKQISLIEEDKCKLGTIRQAVEVEKISIRKTIKQIKQDALSKIKEEFDLLEKKIMADIISQEKKQGYHSSNRFETLSKNLSKQTQILLSFIDGLNSPNFLNWAKKLKKHSLMESNLTRQKIERQLELNATYTANLKWNQSFLLDLQNSIKKLFSVEYVIPNRIDQIQTFSVPFQQNDLNSSTFSRSNSQPKLFSCLTRSNSLSGFNKYAESTSNTFYNPSMNNSSIKYTKQTLLKKGSLHGSDLFNNDLNYSKQNLMTKSSYISDSEINKNSMLFNKFLNEQKDNNESKKLSYLIEAKRNKNFDNPIEVLPGEGVSKNGNSRVRIY